MSLVIARRFGQRILVVSETKITDITQRPDGITRCGLKSIVVTPTLTISWAGLIDPALAVIREINGWTDTPVNRVLERLVEIATEHQAYHQSFLVSSHEEHGAKLFKVNHRGIAEGAEGYWIGDGLAAADFARFLDLQPGNLCHAPAGMDIPTLSAEAHFSTAFMRYLMKCSSSTVGNVAIVCLCSSFGHCYMNTAGAFSFEDIPYGGDPMLRQQEALERQVRNETGQGLFSYNVHAADFRGTAVIGVFLPQPKVGFLYDPLRQDHVLKIVNRDLSFFAGCVHGYVLALRS